MGWKQQREAKQLWKDYCSGKIDREDMTKEQRKIIQNHGSKAIKQIRRKVQIRASIRMAILNVTVKPINRLKKPLPISWEQEYGDQYYPFCPACHEYAYQKRGCVFCGRRFICQEDEN